MRRDPPRVNKLSGALRPQEIVRLWLAEIQAYPSLEAHLRWLIEQPDAAYPLVRLPRMVKDAVFAAQKGRPFREVQRQVVQQQQDVVFLYCLHRALNLHIMGRRESLELQTRILTERLQVLAAEYHLGRTLVEAGQTAARLLPYPLDPNTSAAVRAAEANAVVSWDGFWEADTIGWWVHKKHRPVETTSFPEQTLIEGEYEAECAALTDALLGLVERGEVTAGRVLRLDTVPRYFLREAPLLEGEWLDQEVLAQAEWGALLLKEGFELRGSGDDHPLAEDRIAQKDEAGHGAEVDGTTLVRLRAEADAHLQSYPGRIREVDGRPYVHLDDYTRWKGRWVAGNLRELVALGFLRSSWNQWVDENGDRGTLAGIEVERLTSWAGEWPREECSAEVVATKLAERRGLLASLRAWTVHDFEGAGLWGRVLPGAALSFGERLNSWRAAAEALAADLSTLKQATDLLSSSYFGGQEIRYLDERETQAKCERTVDGLLDLYEALLALDADLVRLLTQERRNGDEKTHTPLPVDRESAESQGRRRGRKLAAYLADVARAETYEIIGEPESARGLLEAHVRAGADPLRENKPSPPPTAA